MNKKIYSILIVLCTGIYVAISLSFCDIEWRAVLVKINPSKIFETIGLSNINGTSKSPKIVYDEVRETTQLSVNKNYDNKSSSGEVIKENNPIRNNNDFGKESSDNKTSMSENTYKASTESKNKQEILILSDLERDKLLYTAKKLSTADQNKVVSLIESGDEENIRSAINLLNERLSEKEFETIKSISVKYSKK